MKSALVIGAAVLALAPMAAFADISIAHKDSGPIFTANLVEGSHGADVMRLQRYLNTHGRMVANTGPGSYQQETEYFGPLTKAALAAFQVDAGIKPASGNFGPITRAYVSTLP